ncbi:FmdB family zinc ribbon protein [Rhodopirellula sallentina]|uniref:Regulatory protein, FmdB, putative domain protein n=1 Tax=Rhodopirellula sallentina SM41 TaxID=1263870 RepID=M5TWW4_9BACT|nr:FmdB family zinc ribbon protein [Rhodopirellula sallentina]EMI53692.1 Regulatory protein, FmdB, putative domain protein [Rhodopirellula sallentina SM41]
MPTYDYLCEACGHELEIFQGINDDPETKCPECKKKKLKRQFGTGAAIVFKGSGFYQTDYRSESYKKGAKADAKKSDSSSGSDKSKSKDSSSKPAKKAD